MLLSDLELLWRFIIPLWFVRNIVWVLYPTWDLLDLLNRLVWVVSDLKLLRRPIVVFWHVWDVFLAVMVVDFPASKSDNFFPEEFLKAGKLNLRFFVKELGENQEWSWASLELDQIRPRHR